MDQPPFPHQTVAPLLQQLPLKKKKRAPFNLSEAFRPPLFFHRIASLRFLVVVVLLRMKDGDGSQHPLGVVVIARARSTDPTTVLVMKIQLDHAHLLRVVHQASAATRLLDGTLGTRAHIAKMHRLVTARQQLDLDGDAE